LVSATLFTAHERASALPVARIRLSVELPNSITWPDLVHTLNQAGPVPAEP
jgi:hypothetical protein